MFSVFSLCTETKLRVLDGFRLWPEFLRLNLQKARHRRRLRHARSDYRPPAPCQSSSDTGLGGLTRCEACHCVARARRYRVVCPALSLRGPDAICTVDSADIRPLWGRATVGLLLPPAALFLLAGLLFWTVLQLQGLRSVSPLAVLWPPRWSEITEARRLRFQSIAIEQLAAGDQALATIALLSAAQTGQGTPGENQRLARLATLGGYHSVADALHSADLARYPAQADTLATAWHDDLLIGNRPGELARLALAQLTRHGAPRGVWLHAFLESIRHPEVAAPFLADPSLQLPHPGLRHALATRAALDAGRPLAAADQLLALAGQPPGPEIRRFLAFSWFEAGNTPRALAAAVDASHPAAPGEPARLVHAVLTRQGDLAGARDALRPLLAEPGQRLANLAALIETPDAVLIDELHRLAPLQPSTDHRELSARWLAVRRARQTDLATELGLALAAAGRPLPAELLATDLASPARGSLGLAVAVLTLDREILYALRAATLPPAPPPTPSR